MTASRCPATYRWMMSTWVANVQGGKRGRGAAGKTPVVTAVQINGDGHPIAMRLSKLHGVRETELAGLAQKHHSVAIVRETRNGVHPISGAQN